MSFLLDTNIILRLVEPAHAMHAAALDASSALLAADEPVHIVPQNIAEWAPGSGGGITVTTGANGTYSAVGVPVGPVTVRSFDPTTGSNGQNTGFVALPGTTVTVNVVVQGSGSWNFGPVDRPFPGDDVVSKADLFEFLRLFPGMDLGWRSDLTTGDSSRCEAHSGAKKVTCQIPDSGS